MVSIATLLTVLPPHIVQQWIICHRFLDDKQGRLVASIHDMYSSDRQDYGQHAVKKGKKDSDYGNCHLSPHELYYNNEGK